jgi:hypothetical protein
MLQSVFLYKIIDQHLYRQKYWISNWIILTKTLPHHFKGKRKIFPSHYDIDMNMHDVMHSVCLRSWVHWLGGGGEALTTWINYREVWRDWSIATSSSVLNSNTPAALLSQAVWRPLEPFPPLFAFGFPPILIFLFPHFFILFPPYFAYALYFVSYWLGRLDMPDFTSHHQELPLGGEQLQQQFCSISESKRMDRIEGTWRLNGA